MENKEITEKEYEAPVAEIVEFDEKDEFLGLSSNNRSIIDW